MRHNIAPPPAPPAFCKCERYFLGKTGVRVRPSQHYYEHNFLNFGSSSVLVTEESLDFIPINRRIWRALRPPGAVLKPTSHQSGAGAGGIRLNLGPFGTLKLSSPSFQATGRNASSSLTLVLIFARVILFIFTRSCITHLTEYFIHHTHVRVKAHGYTCD